MWFLKKQKSVMRQASSKDKRPTINSPSKSQSDMLEQYMMIEKEIRPIESYMANCAVSLNAKLLLNERIETLQKLIDAFYSLKSKCYSLGPEYQTYFSEMWEHAHNSKDADFCYVDRFECELKELLKNKDQLSAKESLYISQSQKLRAFFRKAILFFKRICINALILSFKTTYQQFCTSWLKTGQ